MSICHPTNKTLCLFHSFELRVDFNGSDVMELWQAHKNMLVIFVFENKIKQISNKQMHLQIDISCDKNTGLFSHLRMINTRKK